MGADRPVVLPVGLRLDGRRVVVVGHHQAAERRLSLLEGTGAEVVHVASPPSGADLRGAFLVLLCAGDDALCASLEARARRGEFLLACFDSRHGAVEMPAVVRRGRLQVAVSTSGASPGLSARLRQELEGLFPGSISRFVERLAALRASLAGLSPSDRAERMKRAVAGVEIEGRLKLPE